MKYIPLIILVLLLICSRAMATHYNHVKFIQTSEVVDKGVVITHMANVASILEFEKPETFSFNDVKFYKNHDQRWIIKNNTPVPIDFFPVNINQAALLQVIVTDNIVPAFSEATIGLENVDIEQITFAYQSNLFIPTVNIGNYNPEKWVVESLVIAHPTQQIGLL